MNTQVRIIVAVAFFNDYVMTHLETDTITVEISRFNFANRVSVAILQEDTAAVVPVQILVVRTVAVECQVLNRHIRRSLTGKEREKRGTFRLSCEPEILA